MANAFVGVGGVARKITAGYVGVSGVARKIKAGYVGVNGVARLCYTTGLLVPALTAATWLHASASTGTRAVFAGGENSSGTLIATIQSYNGSMTMATGVLTSARCMLAGATVGGKAVFAGGSTSNGGSRQTTVEWVDDSLTVSTLTSLDVGRHSLSSASPSGHAMFGFGVSSSNYAQRTVYAYDASGTQTTMTTAAGHTWSGGTQTASYGIFLGGKATSSAFSRTYSAISSSMTETTDTVYSSASVALAHQGTASIGGYGLFVCGDTYSSGNRDTVHSVNDSLTFTAQTVADYYATKVGGASGTNYAMFTGFMDTGNMTGYSTTYAYDSSLVRTTAPDGISPKRWEVKGASVGTYCLFAGGQLETAYLTDAVDVWNNTLEHFSSEE